MAAIETPLVEIPSSPTTSNSTEKDTLIARLDELLEKYLHTLDEYQKQRELLSKQLSSGFLSLAQANFQNRSSTIHYGKDCYDERMQAIRKVHISGTTEEEVEFGISGPAKANEEQNDISESASTLKPKSQSATHSEESNDEKQENKEPAQAQKSADPIRWFGILVPQSLRAAQASFVSSIEGPIPALVNIARNLRSQEIEIGRVRKAIKKL